MYYEKFTAFSFLDKNIKSLLGLPVADFLFVSLNSLLAIVSLSFLYLSVCKSLSSKDALILMVISTIEHL